jgi:hypothetical protein
MEDVLLPKSFSCSTPSSEEPEDEIPPPPESVVITIPASPATPPKSKKRVYDARWAAMALMFLAIIMCVAIILWYIFTNNS